MWMSMTGFGRGDHHGEDVSVIAEARSVNHRFLDIHVRCPVKFLSWESRIRSLVRGALRRGKVDVFLSVRDWGRGGTAVRVNHGLLSSLLAEANRLREEYALTMDLSFRDLIGVPDLFVFAPEGDDPAEKHWALAARAVRHALGMLVGARPAGGGRSRSRPAGGGDPDRPVGHLRGVRTPALASRGDGGDAEEQRRSGGEAVCFPRAERGPGKEHG